MHEVTTVLLYEMVSLYEMVIVRSGLCTKWPDTVKGIQVLSNKGPQPFLRGDKYEIAIIHFGEVIWDKKVQNRCISYENLLFHSGACFRQTKYIGMMTKERSIKIVNFMTPGSGVLMLGCSHVSHIVKIHYNFKNLLLCYHG